MFQDEELYLFLDWIYPNTLEGFSDKDVLECGCGGGQHTSLMAPHAKRVTAVDLNTVDIASERNRRFRNVEVIEADIATMDLGRQFDIVLSIGVVHHTDEPDRTVDNLKRHLGPGGRLILWVYSDEGNFLDKNVVEPIRKLFLKNMNRKRVSLLSKALTCLMYIPIYSLYVLPLRFLPYYEYFENFRRMSFYRNNLNVFDKLNAPQVEFISRQRVSGWLNPEEFGHIHISHYKGVSWRASATKK
jgi:SAM-dependent methyltransferase